VHVLPLQKIVSKLSVFWAYAGKMKSARRALISGLAWVCVAAPTSIAQPGNQYHFPNSSAIILDEDDAREAVARGAAAPFETIVRNLTVSGELVGEKLELYQGLLLYELRILSPNGHIKFLHFSARTGRPYLPR
jgi:hypothetical protein